MGIYSLVLVLMLDDEIEERNKQRVSDDHHSEGDNSSHELAKKENVIEVLKIQEQDLDQDKCVICFENEKEMAFYPCGH